MGHPMEWGTRYRAPNGMQIVTGQAMGPVWGSQWGGDCYGAPNGMGTPYRAPNGTSVGHPMGWGPLIG